MTKVELAQKIGNEVCEDCGPESDCGITPTDCGRITNAVDWIETFLNQIASRPKQTKEGNHVEVEKGNPDKNNRTNH